MEVLACSIHGLGCVLERPNLKALHSFTPAAIPEFPVFLVCQRKTDHCFGQSIYCRDGFVSPSATFSWASIMCRGDGRKLSLHGWGVHWHLCQGWQQRSCAGLAGTVLNFDKLHWKTNPLATVPDPKVRVLSSAPCLSAFLPRDSHTSLSK